MNVWVENVSSATYDRLEFCDTAASQHDMNILNIEGWIQCIECLYKFYETPLSQAGFNGSVRELLDHWHNLMQYIIDYLLPEILNYQVVWRKILSSSRKKEWKFVLLLVKLIISLFHMQNYSTFFLWWIESKQIIELVLVSID